MTLCLPIPEAWRRYPHGSWALRLHLLPGQGRKQQQATVRRYHAGTPRCRYGTLWDPRPGEDAGDGLGEAGWSRSPIGMPSRPASSADLHAVIARITPDVLVLLGDGVPRTRTTIIAALADRHPKEGIQRTLMRLAVLEQLVETGGKHTLPASGPAQG
jgi:hypothetical protein